MLVSILVDNVNPSLCVNSAMLANAHAKVNAPNSAHMGAFKLTVVVFELRIERIQRGTSENVLCRNHDLHVREIYRNTCFVPIPYQTCACVE
jgi:hypothetical protein